MVRRLIAVFALVAALNPACGRPATTMDAGRGTVVDFRVNGPPAPQPALNETRSDTPDAPVVIYLVLPEQTPTPAPSADEKAAPDPGEIAPAPAAERPETSAAPPLLKAIAAAIIAAPPPERPVEIDINGQRVRIPQEVLRNGGTFRVADSIGAQVETGSETVAQETRLGAPNADLAADGSGGATGGPLEFIAKFAGGNKMGAAMIVAGVALAVIAVFFLLRGANPKNCLAAIGAGIVCAGSGVVLQHNPWFFAMGAAGILGWLVYTFIDSEHGQRRSRAVDAFTPTVEGFASHILTVLAREPKLVEKPAEDIAKRMEDELKKLVRTNSKVSDTDLKGPTAVEWSVVTSKRRTNAGQRKLR